MKTTGPDRTSGPPTKAPKAKVAKPPAPCIGFRYTVLDEIRIDIAKQRAQAHMDRLSRPDPRQWQKRAAAMTTLRHLWRYG